MTEIALVDAVEVDGHQQTDHHRALPGAAFARCGEPQRSECEHHKQQRPQGVGLHHGEAHVGHVGRDRGVVDREEAGLIGGYLHLCKLVGDHLRDAEIGFADGGAVDLGHGPSCEAEERYGAETDADGAEPAGECLRGGEQLLQGEDGEHRHGEFSDDEYRFHGAETAVHRHVVDKPVGEPLQVTSQSQEHRQQRHDQERPFQRSAHDDAPQHEEHENHGSNVDGAVGALGFAKILADILADILPLHR